MGSNWRERLVSFSPVGGLLAGVLVGWLLAEFFRIHEVSGLERVHDSAVRVFTFAFGLHGWASAVVLLQRRAIHGGGQISLIEAGEAAAARAMRLVHWQFPVIVLALIALVLGGGWLLAYAALLFVSFMLYFDEIDCGNPGRFFTFVWRNMR